MYGLDYTTLLAYGYVGFSVAAAISSSIYFVASYFARSLSTQPLGIYLYRLGLVVALSFVWLLFCGSQFAPVMRTTNALWSAPWYHLARNIGIVRGALSSAAWIIVALIDWPKLAKSPNKSPEPTAVGAGRSAVAVHVASRRWLSFFR